MRWIAPPLPVSITIVAIGLLLLGATGIAGMALSGRFHARAQRLTVPDAFDFEVEPGATIVIMRELAGPHITANRPLEPLPDDLAIAVTDTRTAQPIAAQTYDWWTRQQFFGLERNRRGIVAFRAPEHGRVWIDVRGTFAHDQVLAIGPTFNTFADRYRTAFFVGAGLGGVLVVIGLSAGVLRVARAPGLTPGLPDTH